MTWKEFYLRWLNDQAEKHSIDMNYIHKDMIQTEIEKRIEIAVKNLNSIRDQQEEEQLNSLKLQHKIIEDGFKAEIENYKKTVDDAMKMRKENERLYYTLLSRIKKLGSITMDNVQAGTSIVSNVGIALGQLNKVGLSIKDLEEEIEEQKEKDMKTLRIKQIGG